MAETPSTVLEYDTEWLAILKSTNHLLSVKQKPGFMPGPGGNSRYKAQQNIAS